MKHDNKKLYFQCVICGKLTAGRFPKGGDGTFIFPRKHRHNGKSCHGTFYEARWVTK